jgi:hypothetical protein
LTPGKIGKGGHREYPYTLHRTEFFDELFILTKNKKWVTKNIAETKRKEKLERRQCCVTPYW